MDQQKFKDQFRSLVIYDAGGGGDCGPLSFRVGLKYIYFTNDAFKDRRENFDSNYSVATIRKAVLDEAIKKDSKYIPDKDNWWRDIELEIAAHFYNVKIIAFSLKFNKVSVINDSAENIIYLINNNLEDHFVVGLPKDENISRIYKGGELVESSEMLHQLLGKFNNKENFEIYNKSNIKNTPKITTEDPPNIDRTQNLRYQYSILFVGAIIIIVFGGGGLAGGILLIIYGQYGIAGTLITAVVAIPAGIASSLWTVKKIQDVKQENLKTLQKSQQVQIEKTHMMHTQFLDRSTGNSDHQHILYAPQTNYTIV